VMVPDPRCCNATKLLSTVDVPARSDSTPAGTTLLLVLRNNPLPETTSTRMVEAFDPDAAIFVVGATTEAVVCSMYVGAVLAVLAVLMIHGRSPPSCIASSQPVVKLAGCVDCAAQESNSACSWAIIADWLLMIASCSAIMLDRSSQSQLREEVDVEVAWLSKGVVGTRQCGSCVVLSRPLSATLVVVRDTAPESEYLDSMVVDVPRSTKVVVRSSCIDDVDLEATERVCRVGWVVEASDAVVGTRPSGLSVVASRSPGGFVVVRSPPLLDVVTYLDVVIVVESRPASLVDR